ncbi:HlyC/CorC family transporter [bacterium]|nr:HlyC/CorC family transporter [bacterium]
MITITLVIFLILILLGGIYFISYFETMILSFQDQDIKNLRKSEKGSVIWLLNRIKEPGKLQFSLTVTKSIFVAAFVIIFFYFTQDSLRQYIDSTPLVLLIIGILTWLIYLTFVHILPLKPNKGNLERRVSKYSTMGRLLLFTFSPFIMLWKSVIRVLPKKGMQNLIQKSTVKSEIEDFIEFDGYNSGLQDEEKQMIRHIVEFGETMVREVMVPRIDMVCIEIGTPIDEVIDTIKKAGHSRIPVYNERVDNIIGILYAKDLINPVYQSQNIDLKNILREAYYVPEAKRIRDLLREMREEKIHIAIVVDEYGGTAGLVTMEDLIEEIIGEIQDEYDEEEKIINRLSHNAFSIQAKIPITELNDRLNISIPNDEADTLGGLIYQIAEAIPREGEKFEYGNLLFIVEKIIRRRIAWVKVIIKEEDENQR